VRARHLLALDAPVGTDAVAELHTPLRAALDGSGPALVLLPAGPASLRQALVDAAAAALPAVHSEVSLVVPTSGSTGEPRLAMLTGRALRASAEATAQALGGTGTAVLALPTSHVAGLMVLVRAVLARDEVVVVDQARGFTPEGFAQAVRTLLDRPGGVALRCSLVPTQLARLVEDDAATAALRALDTVLLGGAAAPSGLVDRARAAGVTVVTTYGMTETCGGCVYDGRALPGTEVGLDVTGRIRLRGPTLFDGYLGRPDLTSRSLVDGWFVTDDRGRVDEAGRLHVLGRLDDVIVSGGVKVSPSQVEAAVATHPSVADVVVVPGGDAEWGQLVVAVVEVAAGAPPDLAGLRAHLRDRLTPAAMPRRLVVVDALPRLPSGKPDRAAVRTLVAAAQA
jgi:O-succinylbenzoic acid--CoA ligase